MSNAGPFGTSRGSSRFERWETSCFAQRSGRSVGTSARDESAYSVTVPPYSAIARSAATLTPGIAVAATEHGDAMSARKKKKRVTLHLVFIDAWSSVKLAFLVGLALALVTVLVS